MARGTGAGLVLLGAVVVGRAVRNTGFSAPPCPPLLGGSKDPCLLGWFRASVLTQQLSGWFVRRGALSPRSPLLSLCAFLRE